MTAVRVIGIGSPFGSDRLGWDAIEDLSAYPGLKVVETNKVSFISLDRPGIGLLDYLQGVEIVILIDAVKAGHSPGSILQLEEEQLETLQQTNSTHGFGVAEALALGRELDNLPDKIVLIGMEIGEDPEWMPLCKDMEALAKTVDKEVDACFRQLTCNAEYS